jgi:hypothetical protein
MRCCLSSFPRNSLSRGRWVTMLKTMGTSGYRARKGGHRSGESEPLGRPPSLGGGADRPYCLIEETVRADDADGAPHDGS